MLRRTPDAGHRKPQRVKSRYFMTPRSCRSGRLTGCACGFTGSELRRRRPRRRRRRGCSRRRNCTSGWSVLKMDVEGAAWPVLGEIMGGPRRSCHILMETHLLRSADIRHPRRGQAAPGDARSWVRMTHTEIRTKRSTQHFTNTHSCGSPAVRAFIEQAGVYCRRMCHRLKEFLRLMSANFH
jgi:hypothetical protein